MSTRLGVALVGVGVIARAHARVAVAHPGLRLVAVVGRAAGAAHELARYVQVELEGEPPAVLGSLAEVLDDPTVDLVVVTTPSGSHVEIAEAAVNAGKHVVIEKPIDVRLDRARRMVELAERAAASGIVVSVISQNRFAPAVVAVKRAIESGRFGRITSATATVGWWRNQEYYDSGEWRGTWAHDGGGALMNQGVHAVDLILHFLGRPVEVFGYASALVHERIEVEDVAASVVRFESGAVATVLATTDAFPGNSTRLQVHGSTGSAFLQNELLEYFHADDAHLPGEPRGYRGLGNQAAREVTEHDLPGAAPVADHFKGHLRQYEDVIDAIILGRAPGVTAAQATDVLALVRGVYVSQTLGRPIAFDDVLTGRYDEVEPFIDVEPAFDGVAATAGVQPAV